MRSVFADVLARPKIWRLFFKLIWTNPQPAGLAIIQQYHAGFYQQIEADLAQAVERGEISEGNVHARALILMGSIGECIANHLSMGRPELTPELAHTLVDTMFEGWAPRNTK
jgi:hypothetical protein